MIRIPAFGKNFKVVFLDRDRALLVSDQQQLLIEGRYCGTVAARIDGCSAASEIVSSLGAAADPTEILYAIVQLEQKGLLMDAESDLPPGEAAFWRRLDVPPRAAAARLQAAAFDAIALGEAGAESEIAEALANAGVARRSDAPFVVVIADNYLDPRLGDISREFRRLQRAWMLVKPAGAARIGPLFHPRTACWACLAARLQEDHEPCPAALPSTRASIANLAAAEVLKWLVLEKSGLENAIAAVDLFTLHITRHRFARRPQCAECGHGFRLDPSALRFDAAPVANLEEHVDRLTGIVTIVHKRGASHDFLPVYFAPQRFPQSRDAVACAVGKGERDEEARRSCLAEAIERYCCAEDGSEIIVRCRAQDLDAPHLTLNDLGTAAGSVTDWTPAWSFTRNRKIWTPAEYCFLGREIADSNGCAAGPTLEEAIVRGFFELVERDSLALWWYNRSARPEISPEFDALGDRLRSNFQSVGRTLHLLDLTTDLEIPVVAAISARGDGSAVAFGFGADFDVALAVRHALLELQQMTGAIDDPTPLVSPPLQHWLASINLNRESWLRPAQPAPRAHRRFPRTLAACREIVERHQMEFLAANLTRPGIDLPVARVIVPGLRSAQPRFAPGRLYDVPVKLGWVERPLAESEMNPIPFFL